MAYEDDSQLRTSLTKDPQLVPQNRKRSTVNEEHPELNNLISKLELNPEPIVENPDSVS